MNDKSRIAKLLFENTVFSIVISEKAHLITHRYDFGF